MNILFLAGNKNPKFFRRDPSWIYRCENLGLALQAQGHNVEFQHIKQFNWLKLPDVVVFHRPRMSLRLNAVLLWLKKRRCLCVADFDDLVFDVDYHQDSPGVLNQVLSAEKTQKNYLAHEQALQKFSHITVSTSPLLEHASRVSGHAKVRVLSNAVHRSWRVNNDQADRPPADLQQPIITYLPGTRSHDRDFQVFNKGLAAFINDHSQVRLQITGPLECNLPVPAAQRVHREKVSFAEYPQHIKQGWVNLAPLEATAFTRCKSALKVIEAGYWGIPTVCTPLPDAERFVGKGAIPVHDSDQVYTELQALLDPDFYQSCTHGLGEQVLNLADVDKVATAFLDFVGVE